MKLSGFHSNLVDAFSWLGLGCLIGIFAPTLRADAVSDSTLNDINFSQNLNAQLTLDLPFRDATGRRIVLRDNFHDKPVILVLGYYECPMLCSITINGMVEALSDMKWSIGKEFEIINVSIDPREKPALAAAKKSHYLKRYDRAGTDEGWHFLTGEEAAIKLLTAEAGFHYVYDETSKQYAHPSGLVFLTPDGRISGYLMGVSFSPRDLLAALQKASGRQIGSPVPNWVLLCFHYNPFTGKYSKNIIAAVRLLALLTVAALAGFIVFQRKRTPEKPVAQTAAVARVNECEAS